LNNNAFVLANSRAKVVGDVSDHAILRVAEALSADRRHDRLPPDLIPPEIPVFRYSSECRSGARWLSYRLDFGGRSL